MARVVDVRQNVLFDFFIFFGPPGTTLADIALGPKLVFLFFFENLFIINNIISLIFFDIAVGRVLIARVVDVRQNVLFEIFFSWLLKRLWRTSLSVLNRYFYSFLRIYS